MRFNSRITVNRCRDLPVKFPVFPAAPPFFLPRSAPPSFMVHFPRCLLRGLIGKTKLNRDAWPGVGVPVSAGWFGCSKVFIAQWLFR
jgi:hypothetical protein